MKKSQKVKLDEPFTHSLVDIIEEVHKPHGIVRWLRKNKMLLATLIGVLTGILLGFSLRPFDLHPDTILVISYPGELFMRLLKLIILPLITSSLIAGSASLNAKMNGKIAIRTLTYFSTTSLINAILGILIVTAVHPGRPKDTSVMKIVETQKTVNLLDSILDLGRNVIPDNLFQAAFQQSHTVYVPETNPFAVNASQDESPRMVRSIQYRGGANTLGLVFFCLSFGTVTAMIGERGQIVADFFQAIFEVMMKFVTGIMWLTPCGVASVIAGKILGVADVGYVMSRLLMFVVCVATGVIINELIIMQAIYFVFLRKNPFKFYVKMLHPMLTAAACASTAAALPLTFRVMDEKIQVDSRITKFVLPIGCNINTDGTALYLSIASIFIAQMNGMLLTFGEILSVCLLSTAASLSVASVPSAALVLLLMVLSAIGAPTTDVTLLFAIDWLVDRIRTTSNMLGDCYAAVVVEHLSKDELASCAETTQYSDATNGNQGDKLPKNESIDIKMQPIEPQA